MIGKLVIQNSQNHYRSFPINHIVARRNDLTHCFVNAQAEPGRRQIDEYTPSPSISALVTALTEPVCVYKKYTF